MSIFNVDDDTYYIWVKHRHIYQHGGQCMVDLSGGVALFVACQSSSHTYCMVSDQSTKPSSWQVTWDQTFTLLTAQTWLLNLPVNTQHQATKRNAVLSSLALKIYYSIELGSFTDQNICITKVD